MDGEKYTRSETGTSWPLTAFHAIAEDNDYMLHLRLKKPRDKLSAYLTKEQIADHRDENFIGLLTVTREMKGGNIYFCEHCVMLNENGLTVEPFITRRRKRVDTKDSTTFKSENADESAADVSHKAQPLVVVHKHDPLQLARNRNVRPNKRMSSSMSKTALSIVHAHMADIRSAHADMLEGIRPDFETTCVDVKRKKPEPPPEIDFVEPKPSPRRPYEPTLPDPDWRGTKLRIHKPKSDFKTTAQDALQIVDEHKKDVGLKNYYRDAPHMSITFDRETMVRNGLDKKEHQEMCRLMNGNYEAWILTPAHDIQTPHFFVIKRSKSGSIKHACRYNIVLDDQGKPQADIHGYPGARNSIMTHPVHPLMVTGDTSEMDRSVMIADVVAPDAMAHWQRIYHSMESPHFDLSSANTTISQTASHETATLTDIQYKGTIQPSHVSTKQALG